MGSVRASGDDRLPTPGKGRRQSWRAAIHTENWPEAGKTGKRKTGQPELTLFTNGERGQGALPPFRELGDLLRTGQIQAATQLVRMFSTSLGRDVALRADRSWLEFRQATAGSRRAKEPQVAARDEDPQTEKGARGLCLRFSVCEKGKVRLTRFSFRSTGHKIFPTLFLQPPQYFPTSVGPPLPTSPPIVVA